MRRLFLPVVGSVAALLLVSSQSAAQDGPVWVRTPPTTASRTAATGSANWNAILSRGGQLPKHERLLVLDAEGGVLASIDGEATRVLLPDELFARLADRRLGATLVHNHPDSVSLSGPDLFQLANAGVTRVVAVGHDGSVYQASAAAAFADGALLEREYHAVTEHVLAGILTEGRRGILDPVDFAPQATHLVALVLARLHVIDYDMQPSLALRLTLDRHRASIDRLVDAEVRRVRAEWAAPTATAARVTASR